MRKAAIAIAVLAAAMAATGSYLVQHPAPAAEAPAPPPAPPGVPVTADTVKAADVPVLLNTIGTVQAYNMVTIKTRVDGQITRIDFTEGQEVKAGAPLMQLDPRAYKAALDQANANLEKDQASLANAQRNYARDAAIISSNLAVSQQQFDNDKATVLTNQASVDSDKAQVDAAKVNLDYTTITSPIEGRLGARLVDIGNIVHANDPGGLVTIAQLKPIFISFTLPQNQTHKVRERQAKGPLEVLAYGDDNKTLLSRGKLTLIDNTIDQTTGTIHLKATYDNADERLWPGEFVNVRVVLNIRQGVPTVPAQTVQDGPNGQYAYVIKDDETVERRDVEVAVVQDGIAVISKGLSPGEKVVVEGQYRLTQGARVRPTEAKPAGSQAAG
ncbi:MAG TPA: efflux RND transporter periplasmic adaptor subunit [Stellaceae bacterium]